MANANMDNAVVKSVGRVFEVLELFDEVRTPQTATQIGRRLKYPASSTLALLKSMVKLGYLTFDRAERIYFPTVRVSMLGRWIESSLFGDGKLLALMEDLRARTGETVVVSVQNDLSMQFVHILLGQNFSINLKAGEMVSLFTTAVGIMALSDRPDKEIAKFVDRHNRRMRAPDAKIDLNQLMQTVRRARVQGYAAGYDSYIQGLGGIAFVLKPRTGRHSAVLSISGLSPRIRDAEPQIVKIAKAALKSFNALS